MIVAMLSLSSGIERSASGLIHLGGSELGMFQGGVGELTASTLPQSLVARVKQQPGVADAAPVAVATGELADRGSFLVFGVSPDSFIMRRLVFLAGRPPRSASEALVGDGAARDLGLHVGEPLVLAAGRLWIVGIYHAGVGFEDHGAALALPVVQRILGRPGDATTIAVKLAHGAKAAEVGNRLERGVSRHGRDQPARPDRARGHQQPADPQDGGRVRRARADHRWHRGHEHDADGRLRAPARLRPAAAIGWPRRLVGELVLREGILLSLAGGLIGLGLGVGAGEVIVRAFGASALVTPHVTAWTPSRSWSRSRSARSAASTCLAGNAAAPGRGLG